MPIDANPTLLKFRRTKIVATLGPASGSPEIITRLMEAGVDVFRLNMSHGDHDSHRQTHSYVRDASKKLNKPIAILADLCGPKIRAGKFEKGSIELKTGDDVVVTVIASANGKVRLGIEAPSHVSIDREEVRLRKQSLGEYEWEIEPAQMVAIGAES